MPAKKVAARKGEWFTTYTGKQFWPLDPRPEEVCIEDIAHSLSLQCRFNGHCTYFYSVAHHSILGAESLYETPELALLFLLHDAAETYICDLPRPLKYDGSFGRLYKKAEHKLEEVIATKFNIEFPMPEIIKYVDTRMLVTEKRDLIKDPTVVWEDVKTVPPFEDKILPLAAKSSEQAFLLLFETLIKITRRG